MLKVENIDVYGFEASVRGMRNPMNSWDKSDSFDCRNVGCISCSIYKEGTVCDRQLQYVVGQNDLDLMKRLFKAGTEHRKYLRMIQVYLDITAPLYWWKEFDTYKIGTVANSCSTMHKIHAKEFTLDDFSHEHLCPQSIDVLKKVIKTLNIERNNYFLAKENNRNPKYQWWQMIQLLPSSYNQKRTVMLNYEVICNIIKQRSGHKLDEWHQLIDVFKTLPYLKDILGE